jgi:plasmid stabilization system protein ParE
MAYGIFWTPVAVQDLRDICDFISRDNPVAARRMGEELIKQAENNGALPTERPYGARENKPANPRNHIAR